MTTLYKNTRRIAAVIVATMVLSVGTAVAVTSHTNDAASISRVPKADTVGRFVVTPSTMKFVPPAETVGRFVVSQHSTVFVPGQGQAKA
jgi:hypothetical protein